MRGLVYRDGYGLLRRELSHNEARELVGCKVWAAKPENDPIYLAGFDGAVAAGREPMVQKMIGAALMGWHEQAQVRVVSAAKLGARGSSLRGPEEFIALLRAEKYDDAYDVFQRPRRPHQLRARAT